MRIGIWDQSMPIWAAGKTYTKALARSLREVMAEDDSVVMLSGEDQVLGAAIQESPDDVQVIAMPQAPRLIVLDRIIRKLGGFIGVKWADPYQKALEACWCKHGVDLVLCFCLPDPWRFRRVAVVSWIPDLQEKLFSEYFTEHDLRNRDNLNVMKIQCCSAVTASSEAVREDVLRWYGKLQPELVRFRFPSLYALTEDAMPEPSLDVVSAYGISRPYFLVANQFWKHKNHMVVLKAMDDLRRRGEEIPTVVMIGQPTDYRDPTGTYFSGLLQSSIKRKLTSHLRILGFVGSSEKDSFLRNCSALIQPSLCEGWNTSVEDAKALGKAVYASDIPAHREQLTDNVAFFSPADSCALADIMVNAPFSSGWNRQQEERSIIVARARMREETERYLSTLRRLIR